MLHYNGHWYLQFFLICNDIQYFTRNIISNSKTQNLIAFSKIYKTMEIVIIENLYCKLGIVNGYIQNIIVTNPNGFNKVIRCTFLQMIFLI
jgi:hypothetical protein